MRDENKRQSDRLSKRSWFRIILKTAFIIVILVILLFSAGTFYIYYRGNDLLKEYLIKTVYSSSKGIYHLELTKLNINLVTGRTSVSGLHLIPDTSAYNKKSKSDTLSPFLIDVRISEFQVRGFDIMDIIRKRRIDISKILIDSPDLTIILKKTINRTEKPASDRKMLSIPLPNGLESLLIRQIILENGRLTIDDQTKETAEKFIVPLITISLKNFLVDRTQRGLPRILNSDDILISVKGISLKSNKGMYTVTPGEINLSTGKSALSITNLKITPTYSRFEFSRKLGYQTDRFDISIAKIVIQGLDLRQFLINRKFIAGNILVDGLILNDYRDKHLPPQADFKPPLPGQTLLNLKTYVKIDNVTFTKGKIIYSEQDGDEPGTLYFDKVEGAVSGITNDSVLVRRNTLVKVKASMYLMGKGLLNVALEMPLGAKNDAFTFSATLSKMDLREINPMLTKLFPVEIISGLVINNSKISFKADNYKASGKMDFYYKDLKIKMKARENTTRSKIRSGTENWAAKMIVRNANPKNGKFNQGIIYFERDQHKSIFNFLWKSILSGVKSTIGLNIKEQKELKKSSTKK